MQVNPASLATAQGTTPEGTFVLVAERDYSTGKIYLTAQEISKATLTHSLWKIKVTDRSANGRVYTYVNKETGYELAFDHTNALLQIHRQGMILLSLQKAIKQQIMMSIKIIKQIMAGRTNLMV